MDFVQSTILPTRRPDPRLQRHWRVLDRLILATVASIGGAVLMGWLVPALGAAYPAGWSMMKANTALAVLLGVLSLRLTQPRCGSRVQTTGRGCALAVMALGGAAGYEHLSGQATGLGTWLVAGGTAAVPGLMSPAAAGFLVLLGLALAVRRSRQGPVGHLLDALSIGLVLFSLVLVAGYAFGANNLYGQSLRSVTPPLTVVCLTLLALVLAGRRAPYGFFAVMVSGTIGGRFMRMVLPLALLQPFVVVATAGRMVGRHWLTLPYAAALTAAVMAALMLPSVALLARRLNTLERDLQHRSLVDEMTGVQNYRGFHLLGEHELRVARRSALPVTVYIFDVCGVKQVNESLGHETGSQLLKEFASLLRETFRDSDVVARVGGDEFGVVAAGRQSDLEPVLRRLKQAAQAANRANDRPYRIVYVGGAATAEPGDGLSFAKLAGRAEIALRRQARRARRAQARLPATG